METQFSRLASMRSAVSASMKIALPIWSLPTCLKYRPMISSVNALQKDLTIWNHDFMLIIKKSNRMAMKRTTTSSRSIKAPIHADDHDGSLIVAKRERH